MLTSHESRLQAPQKLKHMKTACSISIVIYMQFHCKLLSEWMHGMCTILSPGSTCSSAMTGSLMFTHN